jgi:hypothetical protein
MVMFFRRARLVREEAPPRLALADALFSGHDKACPVSQHASPSARDAIRIQPQAPIIGQVEMGAGK